MAKYRITAPDGNSYEITAPDGASEAEVMAYAQQNYQAPRSNANDSDFARLITGQPRERGPDPTEGMSGVDRFRAGFAKSFVDTGEGIAQAVTEQARRGTRAIKAVTDFGPLDLPKRIAGSLDRAVASSQAEQQRDIDERRQRDAPLSGTGAGLAGNIAGNITQLLGPGVALRGTVAGRALLPTTIGGNAVQGAAIGALQPVATGESRGANAAIGGTIGAVVPTVLKAPGAVRRAVADVVRPERAAAKEAARIIQREAAQPNIGMVANPSAVPGATRTLFEETLDPGIARLETRSRGTGTGWADRDSANNTSRLAALRGFAGDEAQIAAAIEARDAATSGLRTQAQSEGREFSRMSGMMQDLERARLMMQAEDVASLNAARAEAAASQQSAFGSVGAGVPEPQAFPVMTAQEIDRAAQAVSRESLAPLKQELSRISAGSAGNPAIRNTLDKVRSALDDAGNSVVGLGKVRDYINFLLSGKAGDDSITARAATSQLMGMKEAIDNELAQRAPTYAPYLRSFSEMSKPINRMEIGQELIRRGSGMLDPVTGEGRLMPAQFGRQVRDLDQLAQSATGFGKAQAADILQPSDMATISAVNDDLARQAARLVRGAGGGSHTASQQEVGKRIAVRSLARVIPGVGAAVEFLEAQGAQRLERALERVLANPNEYRAIAALVSREDRRLLEQALLRIAGPGTRSATVTGMNRGQPETPVPAAALAE